MTGYNLPPGCSVGDIPGWRDEDVLWDNLIDRDVCPKCDHLDFCKYADTGNYNKCPILDNEFQSIMDGDR